jgi:hypothetical protein
MMRESKPSAQNHSGGRRPLKSQDPQYERERAAGNSKINARNPLWGAEAAEDFDAASQ